MRNEIKNSYQILIVDDEPLIRESLYEILRIEGYHAHMTSSGEEAIEFLKQNQIDIVVTDMKLPKMSGLDLLEQSKGILPDLEVIIITGYGSIESAVDAIKNGASDYITKPLNDSEIKITINKIIEKKEILKENKNLKAIIAQTLPTSHGNLVGGSDAMQKVYHIIESVANTNATILITGESGTGKGMVAKAIHYTDINRRNKPFVEISCGALSETLLESELFGHVKGAFTGAIKDKEGRFEYARGGTIFLDEIDAFSPSLQVKLLRILQDGVFERVGDNLTRRTDARIIVATNQVLTEKVAEGVFREDLYYRINVISIKLPALRERRGDIDLFVKHFINIYSKKNHKKISGISDELRQLFWNYSWPGNIRELENAIEGAIIMTKTQLLDKWDIPNYSKFILSPNSISSTDKSLKKILEEPEKDSIISVLNKCNWNRNKAAGMLGINRTTLYNKMKKYNISINQRKFS